MKETSLFLSVFKERIYPVLFMVIVTVVCIAGISGIYLSTRDLVKLNETLFLKKSVLYAAEIPVPADGSEIDRVYQSRIREVTKPIDGREVIQFFEVLDGTGDTAGYVVFAEGPGLWGEIDSVVGFASDLVTFTGIDFIDQNETPGLGARITELWFREQFRGKSGPFTMVEEGTGSSDPHVVDAITGATRTSNGVLAIVNGASENIRKILSGEIIREDD